MALAGVLAARVTRLPVVGAVLVAKNATRNAKTVIDMFVDFSIVNYCVYLNVQFAIYFCVTIFW